MQRHFAGAYDLAAIEFLIGSPLAYLSWPFLPELSRQPSVHLDDYFAFAAMIISGTVTAVAAVVTLLHSRLSYGVIRGARIGAALSDVWMLLIGVGMWVIASRQGGDWAALGVVGALLFTAVGTTLLSVFALWYGRRMRPGINSPI